MDALWSWYTRRSFVLVALAIILCSVNFAKSAMDMVRYSGIDLRPKVLGARALSVGRDPYLERTFAWKESTPEAFSDPHTIHYPGLSRVTYPPPPLLLYMPLSGVAYKVQRVVWWMIEWLAMASAIALLAVSTKDRRARNTFVWLAILSICGSWFWRFHVERGQYYILIVELICIEIWIIRSGRERLFGLASGVAAAFRPTMLVLLPLFWCMNQRRGVRNGILVFLGLVMLTLPFAGPSVWKDYFSNISSYLQLVSYGKVPAAAPAMIAGTLKGIPVFAEGYNLYTSLDAKGMNLSVCGMMHTPLCSSLSVMASVLIALVACLISRSMAASQSVDLRLLILTGTLIMIDYETPMRWDYADVMFLPLLAVLIPLSLEKVSIAGTVCLLVGVALCVVPETDVVSVLRQAFFITAMLMFGYKLVVNEIASKMTCGKA